MPLANRPMMEHIVGLLKRHGFDEIVVTVAFLANAIRTYFGDGSEFGVRIVYATEETPLGTAGSVRNAMDELDETFLVISGDVLTDIDLSAIVKFHQDKGALATIGLKSMENPLEFGIVITREDGSIERFLEKPTWGQVFSDTINTGIYVLEPEIFDYIAAGKPVGLLERRVPRSARAGEAAVRLRGRGLLGGRRHPRGLRPGPPGRARRRVDLDIPGFRLRRGRLAGRGLRGRSRRQGRGPGDHRRLLPGRGRRPPARVHRARLQRAGRRRTPSSSGPSSTTTCYLGPGVRLRGCVVGRSGDLRRGARCEEGVVLGDECFVGEHAVINPGVKVYPFKTVEPGAIVNSSIVWESRGARHLFGRLGVAGLANVDISPELAVRLAMAYGTTMKQGRDRHRVPRHQPGGPGPQAGRDGRARTPPAST